MAFKVTSNSLRDGDYLGADHILSADFGFGCSGGNRSPQLAWSGAPAATKSFAVTCFDPDAPTGSGFWHWLVVNIPANVGELPLDAAQGRPADDFGAPGYGGPCPPAGDHPHRYLFTVFAVGAEALPVQADTSAAVVGSSSFFKPWPRRRSWGSTNADLARRPPRCEAHDPCPLTRQSVDPPANLGRASRSFGSGRCAR